MSFSENSFLPTSKTVSIHTTNVTAPVFRAGGIQRLPSTQSSADETESPSTQNKIPLYFFILQTKLLETTGYSYLFDLTLNHSFLFFLKTRVSSNKIGLRIYTQILSIHD